MACLVAEAVLIGAIIQRGLTRRYPFLLAYLAIDLGCSIALLQIPFRTAAYAASFRCYTILIAIAQFAVAAELFERLCSHFHGIGLFRFGMAAVMLALTGVLFLGLLPATPARYPHLMAEWIERWETAVLAATLTLAWWYLTWFIGVRPGIRKNTLAHRRILTAFYASSAVSTGLDLAAWDQLLTLRWINTGMLAADLLCFAAWIACLKRNGESLPPEPPVSPEERDYGRESRRRLLDYVQQAGR